MRVRVLGHKQVAKGSPLPTWAYSAEAYDERDSSKSTTWSCGHEHHNPLQARACGLLSFPEAVPEESRRLGKAPTA